MNTKLMSLSIAVMSVGMVGIIFAVVMEIILAEPVYLILMKVASGLFGVGGPLLGIAIARRQKK